jgi:hypothetical protein
MTEPFLYGLYYLIGRKYLLYHYPVEARMEQTTSTVVDHNGNDDAENRIVVEEGDDLANGIPDEWNKEYEAGTADGHAGGYTLCQITDDIWAMVHHDLRSDGYRYTVSEIGELELEVHGIKGICHPRYHYETIEEVADEEGVEISEEKTMAEGREAIRELFHSGRASLVSGGTDVVAGYDDYWMAFDNDGRTDYWVVRDCSFHEKGSERSCAFGARLRFE